MTGMEIGIVVILLLGSALAFIDGKKKVAAVLVAVVMILVAGLTLNPKEARETSTSLTPEEMRDVQLKGRLDKYQKELARCDRFIDTTPEIWARCVDDVNRRVGF